MNEAAKEAKRAYQKKWREENRTEIRTYQKKWRSENPEKVREYQERYWENKAAQMNKKED